MGLINIISNISNTTMNYTSSIFSSGFKYIAAMGSQDTFFNNFWGMICQMGYFIAKWMLYLVDLMFAFIRQLSGLEMKFDSLENMVSKESDFVFNLLFTATDMITPIIRSLIGIAVALIIFFAILAVIKTQFNSLKTKKPGDIKGVLKDTLRAFVLLLITPLISIIGIIASNLLLKSLYNATNTTSSTSLSAQIFSASATSASTYRTYAQDGQRIPITFDFTQQQEILEYYKNHPIDDFFRDYVESDSNLIYSMGYKIFTDKSFVTYDSINRIKFTNVADNERDYYKIYDRSEESYKASKTSDVPTVNTYRRIDSYKPEYFVMADVIDYGIESSAVTYFKTIEEVLKSVAEVGNNALFNALINTYGIQLLNSDLKILVPSTTASVNTSTEVKSEKSTYREIFNHSEWKIIRYYSTYYDANEESEPAAKMKIEYNHVRGETDELNGAKFIMAIERETLINNAGVMVTTPYFYPLTRGMAVGSEYSFQSDFIQTGQIIAAKGVFKQETYAYPVPTAIRISADGSEVQFYRQDLETVTIGESEDGVNAKAEAKKDSNPFATLWNKIVAVFTPKIDLKVDPDAVVTAYSYSENVVNVLSSGRLSISYMFEDWLSSTIGGVATGVTMVTQAAGGKEGATQIGLFGLNLKNVFIPSEINLFILIIGSIVLVRILFTAVFQLINRSYELFLTIMVYPTACATIPIMDKDEGYKAWSKTYLQRLFSTYGLVLGLNFVIMLLPVISEIEFFSAADIAMSKPLSRFRWLFFSVSYEFLAGFLNLVVVIMFELVAFTLIETIPKTIETMTGGGGLKGVNPIEMFGKVMKITKGVISTVAGAATGIWDIVSTIFSDKKREEQLKKLKKKAMGWLPGSEVVGAAKDHHHMKEMKKEKKEAMNDLKEAMADGKMSGKKEEDKTDKEKKEDAANTKNVQDKFNALLKAESAYSSAVSDPRKSREAAEDKKRENEKNGLNEDGTAMSREDGEAGEDGEQPDLSHRTKKQLKKEKKEAKAIVKRLEKKRDKGKLLSKIPIAGNFVKTGSLTEQEQIALERNQQVVENVENAQQKQKDAKDGVKSAKKENKSLLRKRKNGTITQAEEQKIAQNQQTIDGYKELESSNAEKRKQEVEAKKAKPKKETKEEKRKNAQKKSFGSMAGSKSLQNQYMSDFAKKTKQMQKQLNKSGFMGGKLSSMQTVEDVMNAKKTAMVTSAEEKILDDYAAMLAERDELFNGEKGFDELTARQAGKQSNALRHQHRYQAGTKKGKKLEKKLLGNEQAEAQELARIEQELQTIRPTDVKSMKRYRQLTKRREEIKSNQQFMDFWAGKADDNGVRTGGENTRDKKQLKEERKQRKKTELAQESAYDDLVEAGKKVTPEAIQRQTARRMQPKKKKGKKK